MAYKCVHCSAIYEDGSEEIIKGCTNCKSKFFFYITNEKLKEISEAAALNKEIANDLTEKEKDQIEKDVRDISGLTNEEIPIFLDFESIKIIKSGKYLLDLPKLFSMDKPRVYKLEDGKYIVDLTSIKKSEQE